MGDVEFDVDFKFYMDAMGRCVIPDESAFNSHKEKNVLFVSDLAGENLIVEKKEDGLKKAVCLMIEADYENERAMSASGSVSSESVGGYSVSYDNSGKNKRLELDAKSLEQVKYEILKRYCVITSGSR